MTALCPLPPSLPSLHRAAVVPAALITLALGLTLPLGACSGRSGGDGDVALSDGGWGGGSGGMAPVAAISALEGDWVQKGCVTVGAQSFKKTLRARTTGQATLDYYEGVLIFAGNGCAGVSQRVGPSKLGVVRFARSDASPALAARWGELNTNTGTHAGAIWALPSAHRLCLLGDEIPSSLPSLSAVAASVANLPADNCFVR